MRWRSATALPMQSGSGLSWVWTTADFRPRIASTRPTRRAPGVVGPLGLAGPRQQPAHEGAGTDARGPLADVVPLPARGPRGARDVEVGPGGPLGVGLQERRRRAGAGGAAAGVLEVGDVAADLVGVVGVEGHPPGALPRGLR